MKLTLVANGDNISDAGVASWTLNSSYDCESIKLTSCYALGTTTDNTITTKYETSVNQELYASFNFDTTSAIYKPALIPNTIFLGGSELGGQELFLNPITISDRPTTIPAGLEIDLFEMDNGVVFSDDIIDYFTNVNGAGADINNNKIIFIFDIVLSNNHHIVGNDN